MSQVIQLMGAKSEFQLDRLVPEHRPITTVQSQPEGSGGTVLGTEAAG